MAHRPGRRLRTGALIATIATVTATTLLAFTPARSASARDANPSGNIPVSSSMSDADWYYGHTTCEQAPYGRSCEDALVRALDHARAVLGQPAYALPAGFASLTPARQLLVLVNDDRGLYGRKPVAGLSPRLNAGARAGARANSDPDPVGSGWTKAASNWAGGMASPLFAYYIWMYADGLARDGSSVNIDCGPSHRAGCWSHRDNVLLGYRPGAQIVMGVGRADTGRGPSWSQLFQAYPRSA